MPSFGGGQYLSVDQYAAGAAATHTLCLTVLAEFAYHEKTAPTRDRIIRNFVARGGGMLGSIFKIWETGSYGDCWIIHRALLDRLFHLHSLNKRDEFDLFADWSYKLQFEATNRVRSEPDLRGQTQGLVADLTVDQKARYRDLVNSPPIWHRPDAEGTAKSMGMSFLYRFGYDFASRHVHPMADDGEESYLRFVGIQPAEALPDWRSVLANSILVMSMLLQEGLNASRLRWRKEVYDAVDGIRNFLGSASPEEHFPVARVGLLLVQDNRLAERMTIPNATDAR